MSAARIVIRSLIAVLALGALVVQGGAAWGARWVWDNEQLLKDQLIAQQFDASSEIQELVTQAGLSETGELYLMTSLPQVVPAIEFARYCSRNEPGIGVLGCYTLNDRRIYLFDVTDPRLTSIEPVVAAHEMLHAAWARLTAAEKEEIAILLEEAFASLPSTHPLYERIASYESFSAASRIPELYSIIGTEIATIPAPLAAHYAQYFADRAKVVAHADAVDAVFESLQQELTDLSNELTSLNAEIDGLRFAYDEANAALRQTSMLSTKKLRHRELSRPSLSSSRRGSPSKSAKPVSKQCVPRCRARLRNTTCDSMSSPRSITKCLSSIKESISPWSRKTS